MDDAVANRPQALSPADVTTPDPASRERRPGSRRVMDKFLDGRGASIPDPGQPEPGGQLTRRMRRQFETFERLVAAARVVLFDRDLSEIAVEDITNAADVGKGTFFNYFATKEQITAGMLVNARRTLAQSIAKVESGQMRVPDALVERAKAYLCPESGKWLTYEQNLISALLSEDVRADYSTQMRDHAQFHRRLMELGQAQGSIRTDRTPDDIITVSQALSVGLTVTLWIHGTTPTPELVESTMRTFMRIYQPTAAPAPAKARAARKRKPATTQKRTATARRRRTKKR